MKFKQLSLYLILGLVITIFSSCEKENIDSNTINPEVTDTTTIVVNCNDWQMTIEQDAVGNFVANIGGGAAPFTYLWSTGETTETATFTGEGTYSVTVTDAENCVLEDEITANIDPCESFTGEVVQTPSGTYTATVSGGTAPYTYLWSTGETTSEVGFDQIGTYTVDITDANGCNLSFEIVVDIVDNPCDDLNASAEFDLSIDALTVIVTGGTEPYTYLWSLDGNTTWTTQTIVDPPYGPYSVTVTDANGCEAIDEIVETPPCDDLIVMIENPQATTLFINYSGGTAPYSFLWSTGETTSGINAPGSGTYTVTITDSSGCSAADDISI